MTNVTPAADTRHEVIVDRRIAEAYRAYVGALGIFQERVKSMTRRARGSARGWHRYASVEGVEALLSLPSLPSLGRPAVDLRDAEALRERAVRVEGLHAAYMEEDGAYEGWSRFYMVPGGHIHASMHCRTCNRGASMTVFEWLPELSGLSEADAVAEHGTVLCSACFPSAPVEWTVGRRSSEEDVCPGSGTYDVVPGSERRGFYSGNGGVCQHCGEWVGQASRENTAMRKHRVKKG